MASIEQLTKVLEEKQQRLSADAEFVKLQAFYREKTEQGAVVRNEYTLPQLDTIGREMYHTFAAGKGAASTKE